jgi:GT2 family glycosyltransferase
MTLSVIIPVHNNLEYTQACVKSVAFHTQGHEVIVVDNGSTDGTTVWLQAHRNLVDQIVVNDQNLGFARACNQGLAKANGDHLVVLNNDTIVTSWWTASMQEAFAGKSVGLVGPVTNEIAGPQKVNDSFLITRDDDPLKAYALLRQMTFHRQTKKVRVLMGFCLMFSREVLDTIGGFDPRFGLGTFEDTDFCLRAHFAGFHALIALDAFVWHDCSKTFEIIPEGYQWFPRNWMLFKEKWGMDLDRDINQGYPDEVLNPAGNLYVELR